MWCELCGYSWNEIVVRFQLSECERVSEAAGVCILEEGNLAVG